MTKRYLESLPADEQNAILGGIDNAYISPDEWTDDAENEPDVIERIIGGDLNAMIHNLDLCILEQQAEAEWAQALIEEEDEELNDPPVKCRICRAERPISQMNTNGECPPCQREVALMIKPQPERVDCDGWSI